MTNNLRIVLSYLLAGLCFAAYPAALDAARGTPVISGSLKPVGQPEFHRAELVTVANQPFAKAWRVQVLSKTEHTYEVQLQAASQAPVKQGDTLLVTLYVRCLDSRDETGEGRVEVVFENNRAPHAKSLAAPVAIGRDWQPITRAFKAGESYGLGQAQLYVACGFYPQTLEIGGVTLQNLGPNADPKPYQTNEYAYDGQRLDAPWRKQAEARIERLRKGDLRVEVTDRAGRPMANADVQVRMLRHEFGFGSIVTSKLITEESPNAAKYRATVLRLYNKVVFENDLKWQGWENPDNQAQTLRALHWLQTNNLAVRGHCLVWPSWKNLPGDLRGLSRDPAAVRQRIADHITQEVGAVRGRIVEWDVLNEPYINHDVMDLLGKDIMVDWFKLARQADPKPKLYINDFSILSAEGRDTKHQAHYEQTIKFLKDSGAPIAGIGMQSHFGTQATAPTRMLQILDRFGAFGLEIQGTEHDIDTTDEQFQADFTRDYLTVMFSHPAVVGVLSWGFWEGHHWRPNGAYFRKDWSVKPAGQVWMDLTLKQWWTDERGKTGSTGMYPVRGFLGQYEITATVNGKKAVLQAALPRQGATVRVVME
ncbi:MAG: endo-1,4-beta-xylanase [Verrucomicrobiota bacterium]